MVFKNPEIISLAKSSFECYRLDRHGPTATDRFLLHTVAIIVKDSDDNEVGRVIECTTVDVVLGFMKAALDDRAVKAKAGEWTPKVARMDAAISAGQYLEATLALEKAQKETRLPRSIQDALVRIAGVLDRTADQRFADAKKKDDTGDAGGAWIGFRRVKHDFPGRPAAKAAEVAMAAIEKDPRKKEKLRDSRAQAALEDARDLADDGKKAQALTALKQVQADYDGTQAAQDAARFAAEISDPKWKPTPRAKAPASSQPAGRASDAPDVPPEEPAGSDPFRSDEPASPK